MLMQDAFEINPRIKLPKDIEVPFVTMDRLVPGQRNVEAVESREVKSGSRFEVGDTLMARITPCLENGKIARYLPREAALPQAMGSTEFIVLRGKPGVSTTDFAYYLACSPDFHEASIALMTGTSGRQRVDLAGFKNLDVSLPPLHQQEAISELLGSLDDKIAANNAVVDRSIELCTALVNRALSGETVPLSSVAAITMGTSPKGELLNELEVGKPFFQGVRDFGTLFPSNRVFTEHPVREASAGDILFAVRAPIGEVNIANEDCVIGRGVAAISSNDDQLTLFYLLRSRPEIWDAFQDNGTVFASINKTDLSAASIPWVANSGEIEKVIKPIHDHAMNALRQNQTLASTRDELLPLLMNGKVTVGEASEGDGDVNV